MIGSVISAAEEIDKLSSEWIRMEMVEVSLFRLRMFMILYLERMNQSFPTVSAPTSSTVHVVFFKN